MFGAGKLEVDHIEEVIEVNKTITDYSIEELWCRICCSEDNLQLLCKECHKKRTAMQKKQRSSYKRYVKAKAKYKKEDVVFFVLNDGSIIHGISNLKPKHKYMIVAEYKTLKGSERRAEKVLKELQNRY